MSKLRAGIAAVLITPNLEWIEAGDIWLWGYGDRNAPCEGVHDELSARAVVVEDVNGSTAVLVTVDSGALDPELTARVRARMLARFGTPAEYVCINVSHTHSAPVSMAITSWQPGVDLPDPRYVKFLEERIVQVIEAAYSNLSDATLSFSRGATSIGRDRHFDPDPVTGTDHCDPVLDVIRIVGGDGGVRGVLMFAACHPTSFDDASLISADFPGIARDRIQEEKGGITMFFQGYAGICVPKGDPNMMGTILAADALTLLNGPMDELEGPLDAWLKTMDLPLEPLSDAQISNAEAYAIANPSGKPGDLGPLVGRWAARMRALGSAVPATLPVQLQAFQFGQSPGAWFLIASSHEVTTDLAPIIRSLWPYPMVTLMAYCNSQFSYLPSNKVLTDPAHDAPYPFCMNNYEGSLAFVWYGHRGTITSDVDGRFIGGNIELLDHGWEAIGPAPDVVAMTAWNGKLFMATRTNKLYWRATGAPGIPWQDMGHAMEVVGMAALNGSLFCATSAGKLWQRSPYGYNLPWTHIGHAQKVVAMTSLNGKLFAATSEDRLWSRDPVLSDIAWQHIGHAITIAGMAAANGKLIAATNDNDLHWREPVVEVPWTRFGRAEHVVGMAAVGSTLFVATREGQLWRRRL